MSSKLVGLSVMALLFNEDSVLFCDVTPALLSSVTKELLLMLEQWLFTLLREVGSSSQLEAALKLILINS